jgi:hypothetical protein
MVMADIANADCPATKTEMTATYSQMVSAKDTFKGGLIAEMRRGPSQTPQEAVASLTRAITATGKMKDAVDKLLNALRKAQAENCLGSEASQWSATIPVMTKERDDLAETIVGYERDRAAIQSKYNIR